MFKTDATVRFGQILSAIELLGMGNFNEYLFIYLFTAHLRTSVKEPPAMAAPKGYQMALSVSLTL